MTNYFNANHNLFPELIWANTEPNLALPASPATTSIEQPMCRKTLMLHNFKKTEQIQQQADINHFYLHQTNNQISKSPLCHLVNLLHTYLPLRLGYFMLHTQTKAVMKADKKLCPHCFITKCCVWEQWTLVLITPTWLFCFEIIMSSSQH